MVSTFQGPTRLFDSGRTVRLLLKKHVGPFAKQVGQTVLEAALPEVVSLSQNKKKFKKAIEDGVKKELQTTRGEAGAGRRQAVMPQKKKKSEQ